MQRSGDYLLKISYFSGQMNTDVSFFRTGVQAVVAIIMMVFANLKIDSLGHAFGPWELTLGPFSYVLTLFAVWGAVNAFNMVDGIDGLLGGLSCVSFGALGILFALSGNSGLAFWCFTFIAAILPYICFNLGLFGRRFKVFMGDAGSTLIGFTIIWLLTSASQGGEPHAINAVTALWIIAIPLMDMVAIMYRRLRKGMSPFSPRPQVFQNNADRVIWERPSRPVSPFHG